MASPGRTKTGRLRTERSFNLKASAVCGWRKSETSFEGSAEGIATREPHRQASSLDSAAALAQETPRFSEPEFFHKIRWSIAERILEQTIEMPRRNVNLLREALDTEILAQMINNPNSHIRQTILRP